MRDRQKWRAILLFGVPGSGKGTQGKALGCMPGFLHIATGEIFRKLNPLGQYGKQVASYTSAGKLVPDDLTIEIWRNHMSLLMKDGSFDPGRQIILLDGLPRTVRQAEMLAPELEVLRIFYLKLRDDEEALARMKARARREKRADDLNESVARGRLQVFYRDTAEILNVYDPSLIAEIDGSQPPMRVLADLASAICQGVLEPVAVR